MIQPTFSRTAAKFTLMMISAKGGVGKSTLTVNLAAALAARGKRVGIFDADLYGPNIPALLGVRQRRDLNLENNPAAMFPIEARPEALDMRPLKPFERYGLQIMSLALLVGDRQPITPESKDAGLVMAMLLRRVDWSETDILLIDMPPGTGEPLNTLLSAGLADAALVITVREQLAHLDNGRLVNLLRAKRLPLFGVVENMTHVICPNCGEKIELYPAPAEGDAAYGGAPVLASIPFHPHLIRQNWHDKLLADADSPATQSVLALADSVLERMGVSGKYQPPPEEDCEDCP